MIKPFHALIHASRLWWREYIGMMFLNILWILFQVPIVTGPPATAVLYAIALRTYEDELWELQDTWQLLRAYFWPAWRWALPNLLLLLVLVGNFYSYATTAGPIWIGLRLIWGLLLTFWVLLNLYYWPFWLAQEDKSLRTTYANCGRFLLLNPWPSLIISFTCLIVIGVSALLTLPLIAGAISWLTLVGTAAVQGSLSLQKNEQESNR